MNMPDEMLAALTKKLRLPTETRLLALDAPDEYLASLRQPGVVASLATAAQAGATYGAVHLFARDQAQARQALPIATAALRAGGVLWVMWPKQSARVATDLTRDSLAALALTLGWGPVSNVSINETWSALRLRPEADVKRTGSSWSPAAQESSQESSR
jgi:hypothetical protein